MIDIAFIPARGGSKGFPNKNLALVNDESLIVRAIRCALKTNQYSRIVFSSDSDEYIAHVEQLINDDRVIIHKRLNNASDVDEVDPMIVAVMDELIAKDIINTPRTISLLYPTSPGRTVESLTKSIQAFDGNKPVIGVNSFSDFIWTNSPYTYPLNYNPLNRKSRQLAEQRFYRETKSIYHFNYSQLKNSGTRLYEAPELYEVPYLEGIDIDCETDLLIFRHLLKLNEDN